jgi:hypothetical protein
LSPGYAERFGGIVDSAYNRFLEDSAGTWSDVAELVLLSPANLKQIKKCKDQFLLELGLE